MTEKLTQHQKIFLLHADGGYVCGNAYRAKFIFSSHKRRKEIEKLYGKKFTPRKCLHGYKNVLDYLMEDAESPPNVLPKNWMDKVCVCEGDGKCEGCKNGEFLQKERYNWTPFKEKKAEKQIALFP